MIFRQKKRPDLSIRPWGAVGETRTRTGLLPLPPQSSVSTISPPPLCFGIANIRTIFTTPNFFAFFLHFFVKICRFWWFSGFFSIKTREKPGKSVKFFPETCLRKTQKRHSYPQSFFLFELTSDICTYSPGRIIKFRITPSLPFTVIFQTFHKKNLIAR